MTRLSYDERQIEPPLRTCETCGKSYYMRAAICAWCGPGFRTKQHPEPSQLDVSGNLIEGDY